MELVTVVLRHPDPERAKAFVAARDAIEARESAGELTKIEAEAEMGKIGSTCGEPLNFIGYLPAGKLQGPIYHVDGKEGGGLVLAGDILVPRELFDAATVYEVREN